MTGCAHYKRRCEVLAECCQQWVNCRLCHNETFENHEIDRHAIRKMRCSGCQTVQPCARECTNCQLCMADYFCKICNLFDDAGKEKQIFHCDECGICRVGGRENYYHCKKCCGCYPHSLANKHKCLEGSMHRECPICLEITFSSLESVNVLPCGHVMHVSCHNEYVKHNNVICPTCRTLMFSEEELRGGQDEDEDGENEDNEEEREHEDETEEDESEDESERDSESDREGGSDEEGAERVAD